MRRSARSMPRSKAEALPPPSGADISCAVVRGVLLSSQAASARMLVCSSRVMSGISVPRRSPRAACTATRSRELRPISKKRLSMLMSSRPRTCAMAPATSRSVSDPGCAPFIRGSSWSGSSTRLFLSTLPELVRGRLSRIRIMPGTRKEGRRSASHCWSSSGAGDVPGRQATKAASTWPACLPLTVRAAACSTKGCSMRVFSTSPSSTR